MSKKRSQIGDTLWVPQKKKAKEITKINESKERAGTKMESDSKVSNTVIKLRSMLTKLGEQQIDWVYLVEDRLSEKAVLQLRNALHRERVVPRRQYSGPVGKEKQIGSKLEKMTSRNDLKRAPLHSASRFEIGQWINDADQNDTITIKKAEIFLETENEEESIF